MKHSSNVASNGTAKLITLSKRRLEFLVRYVHYGREGHHAHRHCHGIGWRRLLRTLLVEGFFLPETHRIHTGQLPAYVQRFLVAHASLFEQAEKIVIEHQLRGLMKTLEQMLHLKFYERVLIVQPRAVKKHYGCATRNYEANKRAAVRWASELVAAEAELFEPEAVASFESEAKQDDMADALMLVCFFRQTYVGAISSGH